MLVLDRRRFRRGFSLVEILVAVLLIGILMAVAAPRLLGAREGAADSAAQQQISQVASAAEVKYLGSESFAGADAAGLEDDLPDIEVVSGAAGVVPGTSARQVSVWVSTDDKTWRGAAWGGGGNCWFMEINYSSTGTQGDRFGIGSTNSETCDAANGTVNTWNDFEFPAAP